MITCNLLIWNGSVWLRDGHSRSLVSPLFNFILFDKNAIWVGTSILLVGGGGVNGILYALASIL